MIGNNIRKARMRKGLTQAQAGKRLGISHQQISKYELGKSLMDTDILVAFCKLTGASYKQILEGKCK